MSKKNRSKYNSKEIRHLKNDKPVVYEIQTKSGNRNYVGSAKKGRVVDKIKEHLSAIPGDTVKIKQYSSIADARKAATSIVAKDMPRYNKKVIERSSISGSMKDTDSTGPRYTSKRRGR